MRCAACDHDNPHGQKFCGECGAHLVPHDVSRKRESAVAYTPPHLAQGVLSVGSAMEGERKQVTVLFCDIVNATAQAERLGPEPWHGVLNRFFELALTEVHNHGGTLNQFLGDGFMALFGAPLAHEDHAVRAAHAAISIRHTLEKQQGELGLGAGPMQVRMGLNTGSVVVGKIGDNLRMDYTAIGDTTNLAARLQQTAAPGEINVSQTTWKALSEHLDCEALGQRRIKGKAYPVAVYRLMGVRHARSPNDLFQVAVRSAPLVGRQKELEIVRTCVQRLRHREGGVAGLIGEPGLGKSRLLLEAHLDEASDLTWLEGRALSFGQTLTYGPFIEALRGISGIHEDDSRDECWHKVESFIRGLFGRDGDKLVPYVGMLMGLELPPVAAGLVERLDAQDVRGQIFTAARRLFEALAHRGPVVLELEDWQWADDASAALLDHLLPLVEREALLVFFAGRPDPGTPCTRLRDALRERLPQRYTELLLAPLSSSEANQLIDNLFAVKQIPPRLRGLILQKAEGNPLFIEEVVRSLHATGAVRSDLVSGAAHVMGDVNAVSLPDGIEAIIMARIDRLEEEVRQVLRLAAVIGRTFYRRILQALDGAEHQLDACLQQLQQLELIREKRLAPEVEYMFKHALVQEASYRSILGERRRQLHKRVGAAIETLFRDRLDEFASFLAYHYARAGDWQKAQAYLLRAGDQAARMAADVEATAHYRAALEACIRAFGDRWDPVERASLERRIGEALFRLGQYEQASEYLHRALILLGVRYPRSSLGVRTRIAAHVLLQAWHQMRPRRYGGGAATFAQADQERARAHIALGWLDYFRDQERFFLDVVAGLNWAEQRGNLAGVAHGSMGLGIACDVLGLQAIASYYHRRALCVANRVSDPPTVAAAEFGLAVHQMYLGEWAHALDAMQRASDAWQHIGRLREWGVACAACAWLLEQRSDFGRSQATAAMLRHTAEEAGDVQTGIFGLHLGALARRRQGLLEEAAADLEKSCELSRSIPDYQIMLESYAGLARCRLWMGDLQAACRAIEAGDLVARANRVVPHLETSLRASEAEVMLALLERAQGRDGFAARGQAKRAVTALRRLGRRYAGAVPLGLCAQARLDWLRGRRADAQDGWRVAISAAERLGSQYYCAAAHYEMGRLTREPSALQEAVRLFDAMGATFELARTFRCLGETLAVRDPEAAAQWFTRAVDMHGCMSAEYELSLTLAGQERVLRGTA